MRGLDDLYVRVRVSLRPSGTQAKAKAYLPSAALRQEETSAHVRARTFADNVSGYALLRIGFGPMCIPA